MISVGLDIGRLGLMVVQGQPKAAAEYIQATSRVGRQADKPGLVLALLNVHKPRDRLHYEGFRQFHACFYRAVEATSVTPWAARAMDRALAAVVVAAARHLIPALTPDGAAGEIGDYTSVRADILKIILDRAPPAAVVGGHAALTRAVNDAAGRVGEARRRSERQRREPALRLSAQRALLHDPFDPLLDSLDPLYRRFRAGRSMRDVEHSSAMKITDPYGQVMN